MHMAYIIIYHKTVYIYIHNDIQQHWQVSMNSIFHSWQHWRLVTSPFCWLPLAKRPPGAETTQPLILHPQGGIPRHPGHWSWVFIHLALGSLGLGGLGGLLHSFTPYFSHHLYHLFVSSPQLVHLGAVAEHRDGEDLFEGHGQEVVVVTNEAWAKPQLDKWMEKGLVSQKGIVRKNWKKIKIYSETSKHQAGDRFLVSLFVSFRVLSSTGTTGKGNVGQKKNEIDKKISTQPSCPGVRPDLIVSASSVLELMRIT